MLPVFGLFNWSISIDFPHIQVVIVVLLAVSALAQESIISYDAEDHKHEQNGDAGNAVRGSYR